MSDMIQRFLPPTIGVLAIAIIALGVCWSWFFPPQSYWSPQKAQEYQDAFNAVHAAQDAVKDGRPDAGNPEFVAARERFELLRSELQRAQRAHQRTGKYVAAAGLVMLLSSVLLRQYWGPPTVAADESYR